MRAFSRERSYPTSPASSRSRSSSRKPSKRPPQRPWAVPPIHLRWDSGQNLPSTTVSAERLWEIASEIYERDTGVGAKVTTSRESVRQLASGLDSKAKEVSEISMLDRLNACLQLIDDFILIDGKVPDALRPPREATLTGFKTLLTVASEKIPRNQTVEIVIHLFRCFHRCLEVMTVYRTEFVPERGQESTSFQTLSQLLVILGAATYSMKDEANGLIAYQIAAAREYPLASPNVVLRNVGVLGRFHAILNEPLRILVPIASQAIHRASEDRIWDHKQLLGIARELHEVELVIPSHITFPGSGADQLWREVHAWLKPRKMGSSYHEALDVRYEGTGKWVMNHPEIIKWMKSNASLCWIFGAPGNGKTVLSSTIIENLQKDPKNAVIYFYFEREYSNGGFGKRCYASLLTSLVDQLFDFLSTEPTKYANLLEVMHRDMHESTEPHTGHLEKAFEELCKSFKSPLYIITIGLDRSHTEEQRRILKFICATANKRGARSLRLLVTSCPERNINLNSINEMRQGWETTYFIDLRDCEDINADIQLYIGSELDLYSPTCPWNGEAVALIENSLSDRHTSFLWASSRVQSIQECRGLPFNRLKVALSSLPGDLTDRYYHVLQHLEPDEKVYILQVLGWVAHYYETPTSAELNAVYSIHGGSYLTDPGGLLPDPTTILDLSRGLLTARNGDQGQQSQEQDRVHNALRVCFAHPSIKEYITTPGSYQWPFGEGFSESQLYGGSYSLLEDDFRLLIARVMLEHFSSDQPSTQNLVLAQKSRELKWMRYIVEPNLAEVNHQVLNYKALFAVLRNLFDAKEYHPRQRHLYEFEYNEHRFQHKGHQVSDLTADEETRSDSLFKIACRLGVLPLVRYFLSDEFVTAQLDVNKLGYARTTALHIAVEGGDKDVTELLLANGADPNAVDGIHHRTPLHMAIISPKRVNPDDPMEAVAKLLLDSGANVDATDSEGNTPLHLGAQKGAGEHWEMLPILSLLLKKGANANVVNSMEHTPLNLAINHAPAVVRLLLSQIWWRCIWKVRVVRRFAGRRMAS